MTCLVTHLHPHPTVMNPVPRLALLLTLTLALPLTAQIEREGDTPTLFSFQTGITATAVGNLIGQGYRPIDLEVQSASPLLFTAAFVHNSGPYASGMWWYYGQTAASLASNLAANQARLIDLEPYDDGAGNIRFAAVMVPNTGANQRLWWHVTASTPTAIASLANANTARIIDLDEYTQGGSTYYSAILLRNTGADGRAWWWYLDVPAASVDSLLTTNQARPIDLDRRANGNFNVVMQRDPTPTSFVWRQDLAATDVQRFFDEYGQRPIDVESHLAAGVRRYTVVGIRNTDAVTAEIIAEMHAATDGTMGSYMRRLNGAKVHGTNENAVFEPASTLKTVHHAHAIRQVEVGAISFSTMLTVNQGMTGSCPNGTNPMDERLDTVLNLMMVNSDNARTQAVTNRFGMAAMNAIATALGMTSTSINHHIGCAGTPNRVTLADLCRLHEQIANGWLGNSRMFFYSLMRNGTNRLGLDQIITDEAAALGLPVPTRASFRGMVQMAHKGGSYGTPQGVHRAEFGYLSLPFIENGNVVAREFGFGAYVNGASGDSGADQAVWTIAVPKMLRAQVRAAMLTWSTVTASAVAYGTGCGTPQVFQQTPAELPHLDRWARYQTTTAPASSLVVMAIGFSDSASGRITLPHSIVPYGGEPGCFALCDIVGTQTSVAWNSGWTDFVLAIPNQPGLTGQSFFTQFYAFGSAGIRASNGVRSVIGR